MKWCVLFLLLAVPAAAQDRAAELRDWLNRRAESVFAERAKHEASLRTRAELVKWQNEVRVRFQQVLGAMPTQKTLLNAKVTGQIEHDRYRIEKVQFESMPGFVVTANLYIPRSGQGPFPAVLGVAGHSNNGKANDTYQHAWIGFVQRGYVVLAFDPVGQGERVQLWDKDSKKGLAGVGVPEHNVIGMQLLLTGSTMAGVEVWDGIRAFDYLLTRPEVDPQRVAVAGNSGGGTQAAYLAVADQRLAAVVSSCYPTRWRDLWLSPGPQDAEQSLPGFLNASLDFPDYPVALAPRPYLMTSAVRDYFPIAGARSTYQTVRSWYALMDAAPKAGFFEYDDGHGWSQPRREAAYRFLDKWIRGVDSDGAEGKVVVEPEANLQVTPTGQVMNDAGSVSIQKWNTDRAADLRKQRPKLTRERLLALVQARKGTPDVHVASQDQGREHWTIGIQEGLNLPVRVRGAGRSNAKVVLLASIPQEGSLAADLESAGYMVVGWTPRGVGDSTGEKGQLGYSGSYQLAARAWLLGDSLARMQAEDAVMVLRAIRAATRGKKPRMYLLAHGPAAPATLIGVASEGGIDGVFIDSGFRSYEEVVRTLHPTGLEPLVWPGILKNLDLPEVAAFLSPAPVEWVSSGLPSGESLRGLLESRQK